VTATPKPRRHIDLHTSAVLCSHQATTVSSHNEKKQQGTHITGYLQWGNNEPLIQK